jgi:putative aminopeptidase FrvX
MPFETVVHKTMEYLKIPSVVGHEKFFLSYLAQDFEKLGLQVKVHEHVLEVSGNRPYSCIMSAHADRHGLISLGDSKFAYAAQYIRRQKYAEDSTPTKKTLKAIHNRFVGEDVFAYDPQTGKEMASGTIMDTALDDFTEDAYFLIDGITMSHADIPVAYARNAITTGNLLKGQVDNVVSLGIIYVLFQNGFQGTALLTTEEEIGKSWRHLKGWLEANKVETQELIVLDTSPYREKDPIQNNRVVLRNRDKSGVFNPALTQELRRRCEELNLHFQVKDEYFLAQGLKTEDLGSTELGRLVLETGGRWNGATVQIPTTEYHTSYETTSRGCIESYYRLLSHLLIENSFYAS